MNAPAQPSCATPSGTFESVGKCVDVDAFGPRADVDPISASADDRARAEALLLGYALPAGPVDADLIQRDIVIRLRRTVEDVLHVGRALIVLKTLCGHGNYLSRLKVLGLNGNVASRFMKAARKFSASPASRNLLAAVGKQSKLFELLVLDEEQIEDLALTGRTGALSVESIAGMNSRQLRVAVQKERAKQPELLAADDDVNVLADENLPRTLAAQVRTTNQADALRIAGLNPAAPVIGELAECDVREAEAQAASRLQAGDRIISRHALRAGTVVKVYPDGSACVVWDDGKPPPDGMGHERMPRALLVLAQNVPATLARRKAYGQALSKTLLRYADEREVDDVVAELEALVRQISERRATPGLVAARYDLFRKFWLQGGAV